MPDRLAELIRQRALVQEHLAWLNQQIADAANAAKASRPAGRQAEKAVAPPASPLAPTSPPAGANLTAADEILARYRVEPTTVKQNVRKGCLLYFVAALLLLGAGIAAFYFLSGASR